MKKLIVCISLVLVLATAIVAVSVTMNPSDNKDVDPAGLASAKEYLSTMLNAKPEATGADYTLPAKLKNKQGDYTVEWTLTVISGPAEGVKLGAIDEKTGTISIDVDEFSAEEIVYTITGTIIDAAGNKETLVYNRKVPAFGLNTYEEFIAACKANDGKTLINIKGYVIGINADPTSSSKGSIWLVDDAGYGYYAYAPKLAEDVTKTRESINAAFPVGTGIVVKGTATKYGGCYEFNKGCEIIYTGENLTESELPYVDRTELFASAAGMQDGEKLDPVQSTRVSLEGVILGTKPASSTDYNFHFTVDGIDYICYMQIYLLSEEENAALVEKWEAGKKANLTGLVNVYSNNFQVYPDSVDSIEIVIENLTDAEKIAREKDMISREIADLYNVDFTLPAGGINADVEWAIEGEGATLGENNAVTLNQTSVEQTITLIATITSGSVSETVEFTVKVAPARTSFIKAALVAGEALEHNTTTTDSYMIIGTVSEITEAYSEQYENVTFYVIDAEGNELMIYRYKGDDAATIAVGDAFAYAAPIKKYNTTIEAVAPFVALNVTSLADAAAAGIAGTGVEGTVIYGYVKEIKTVYNSQYDNITVILSDGTNTLDCYRLKGGADIAVGDYIMVTGTPSAYNNAAQMAQGATYVKSAIYVAPEEPENPETPAAPQSFIQAALAAGAALADQATTTDSYMIIGTVSEITTAYNSQYGNVSFKVADDKGNSILVFRYDGADAETIAVGDAFAYAAPIKKYGTTIEAVADFVALNVTSLTDAAAAGIAGTGVEGTVIYGYVKEIKTVYNSQYDNITVTLSDGTNDLDCYRLKGGADIVVGDCIMVTGTPSAYNSAAQMAAGATYVKSAIYVAPGAPETPEDPENPETPEDPEDPEVPETPSTITTIAGALAGEVGASVELTGNVSAITSAWNGTMMSYKITDGTNEILLYRATNAQVTLGDRVSVTGSVGDHDGSKQIVDGFATIVEEHVCSTYTEATCTTPAECTICGTINGEALGHKDDDSDGACDRCSANVASNFTYGIVANFGTYGASWGSSYVEQVIASSALGTNLPEATITISRGNKQASTITDRPVIAGKSSTEYVTIELANDTFASVTFNLTQWTTKTFNDIHIEYFDGTNWVSCSDVITTPANISSTTIPANVNKVRLSLYTTKTSNNQVGLGDIIVELA